MDKYEYRIRAEEINALIEQKDYIQAVKIADTIDWRRVRSVVMLCKVSELYKINRRYEESKEVLLLAYDLQPGSRKIVYSLCELSIKLEETVQAVEYYLSRLRREIQDVLFYSIGYMKHKMSVWKNASLYLRNIRKEIIGKNGHMSWLICITGSDLPQDVWKNVMNWFYGLEKASMS